MPSEKESVYRWTQHANLLGSITAFLQSSYSRSEDSQKVEEERSKEVNACKAVLSVLSSYLASTPVPPTSAEAHVLEETILQPLIQTKFVQAHPILQDRLRHLKNQLAPFLPPTPSPLATSQ